MNICFIANDSKTFFFEKIADQLLTSGIQIYWIAANSNFYSQLSKKYGENNVLHIGIDLSSTLPIEDLKINEIIFGDRVLKDKTWANKFLETIQQPIYKFITSQKISFVFGELTWGHEILIHRLIKTRTELNCKFLNPHTIRIPSGYFGFFTDEKQSELLKLSPDDSLNNEDFQIIRKKPEYLKLNDQRREVHFSIKNRSIRFYNFLSGRYYDTNDPTASAKTIKNFIFKIKTEINRELYRFVKKTKFAHIRSTDKYILFPLHKQPEASIDVVGRYYENQYLNILNVWRTLPSNWLILVKEHSNAVGDRSPFFYKKICSLPGVILIDEHEDSYVLMEHAQAIVTVSGTAAYEAAISGIKSFTFSNVFFNKLINCKRIILSDFESDIFSNQLQSPNKSTDTTEFRKWLQARSAKGIISDPLSDKKCMDNNNIIAVSNAFKEIILQINKTSHHPSKETV